MIRLFFCNVGTLSIESTLDIYKKTPAIAGVIPSSDGRGFYDSARGYISLISLVTELYGNTKKTTIDINQSEVNPSGENTSKVNPGEVSPIEVNPSRENPCKKRPSGEAGCLCSVGEIDFSLERGEYGKPKFSSLPISFSISHRGDVVAIILSDEGEVGVDLEAVIPSERAAGIEARFLKDLYPEDGKIGNIEISFATLGADGEIRELEIIYPADNPESSDNPLKTTENDNYNLHITRIQPSHDITSRWTALEALLKLSGGGFADFPRAALLADTSRIASFSLPWCGAEYRISVAIKKQGIRLDIHGHGG